MGTKKETKYQSYNCPLLGGTVQITLEYLIHIASGVEDKKALSGFDCDSAKLCGVGTESGRGAWTFNWGKCVHPLYRKE
jgi:hypothetical protein